jgi:hypothetical protein
MAKVRSIRFRYTLRALLVFVTLFMLWGGYHTNRGIYERRAMALIIARGGSCSSHLRKPEGIVGGIKYAYSRLVRFLWREPFTTHVHINSKLEPEVVSALLDFPHLESLGVQPIKYSLQQILRMKDEWEPKFPMPEGALIDLLQKHSLENLDLSGWILTDTDCRAVASHHTLLWMSLYGCDVSEDGFAEIMALPHLRSLNFSCTKVNGDKLAHLSGSASLEQIDGSCSGIGQECAKYFARCPNLRTLVLSDRSIDDAFVARLGPHSSLERLHLYGGGITDGVVQPLTKMPALKVAGFPRGAISDQAIAKLQKAMPGLVLSH